MPPKVGPSSTSNAKPSSEKSRHAAECLDILVEISTLLNANLNRNQLAICVSLIENGVNPEALATAIQELRAGAAQEGQGQNKNAASLAE